MPDWFLNPALTRFRAEVNERWPNRDKASDGTIGDRAHQATNSDHNPDPDGSVDAWDMDSGPGVDVDACIAAALKHEAIQYVIYNRRITSRSWGLGVWRPYDGASPHTEHVHFNTRPSHENSSKPWFPPLPPPTPEVPDMVRLKARDNAARYLSNGAHIPSIEIDQALAAAGVPLVEVNTTAELQALLPPAAPTVEIHYEPLGEAVLAALLRAAGLQS